MSMARRGLLLAALLVAGVCGLVAAATWSDCGPTVLGEAALATRVGTCYSHFNLCDSRGATCPVGWVNGCGSAILCSFARCYTCENTGNRDTCGLSIVWNSGCTDNEGGEGPCGGMDRRACVFQGSCYCPMLAPVQYTGTCADSSCFSL